MDEKSEKTGKFSSLKTQLFILDVNHQISATLMCLQQADNKEITFILEAVYIHGAN